MSEFKPSFDQAYAYYSYRMPMERLAKRDAVNAHCPFHEDKHPSLSLNLAKGVWNCRSCNQSGGMLDFERTMMGSDAGKAWDEIYRITGMERPKVARRLVATYDYLSAAGKLLYQKLRYEPKDFVNRQPDAKGGWIYNLNGVKKVLYRLPEVVTARYVFVVEGEKDADNLRALLAEAGQEHWTATSTFDGAGHWKPEYAAFFTGKWVGVLRDNDAPGKAHQQAVCASVKPFAERVKAIDLPGLPAKGDVSDWLKTVQNLDVKARCELLLKIAKETPVWEPELSEHELLEEMRDFLDRAPAEIEWLVEGLIPVRTRGLMVADPKVGKSPLSLDLALALASGSSWLGHVVPQRRRVALISREDSPDQIARNLMLYSAGTAARGEYNWGQIWVNTMAHSPLLHVDNTEQLEALIREIQMEQFDLVIFDVLNVLHSGDENDNTVMGGVLAALKRIQVEARCGILLLHHVSKQQSSNIFRDARGAGAIHGWTEWGVGMTVVDETAPRKDWVRKVDFELKYACPADTAFFKIVGDDFDRFQGSGAGDQQETKSGHWLRIELTDPPAAPARKKNLEKAKEALGGSRPVRNWSEPAEAAS